MKQRNKSFLKAALVAWNDFKGLNIWVTGVPEGTDTVGRWGAEKVFGEIMAEKFLNLMKTIKPHPASQI